MIYTPEQRNQAYDIVAHPTMSDDEKQAKLDAVFAPPDEKQMEVHEDKGLAPKVPKDESRPLAPGEYVKNPDKSWSSELTMTVEHPDLNEGKPTNLPSLWMKDGKPHVAKDEDEAVSLAKKSGLEFPTHSSIEAADSKSVERENQWTTPEEARNKTPLWKEQLAFSGNNDVPLPNIPEAPDLREAGYFPGVRAAPAAKYDFSPGTNPGRASPAAAPIIPPPTPIAPVTPIAPAVPAVKTPVTPPPATPDEVADTAMQHYIANASIPHAGIRVPEHAQPVSETVTGTNPVSEDLTEEAAAAKQDLQILGLKRGDIEQANAQRQSLLARKHEEGLREQQETMMRRQTLVNEHLDDLQKKYDQTVKDNQVNPNAYWANKNTGQTIMAVLGGLLLGLGGHPEMVTQIIQNDIAQRNLNASKNIGAAKEGVEFFKMKMSSQDAADQMELSMGQRIAAAEAERFASNSGSAEAKQKAEEYVAALNAQAAQNALEAARKEAGAHSTQIAIIPAHTAGGSPGGVPGAIGAGKKLGYTPRESLVIAAGGKVGGNEAPDDIGLRVIDPATGRVAGWANTKEEKQDIQKSLQTNHAVINDLNQYEKLLGLGESIAGPDKARMKVLSANIVRKLQTQESEGKLSRGFSEEMRPLFEPGGTEFVRLDASTKAALQQIRNEFNHDSNSARSIINKVPTSQSKVTPTAPRGPESGEHAFREKD
jgi:hypothetical protein